MASSRREPQVGDVYEDNTGRHCAGGQPRRLELVGFFVDPVRGRMAMLKTQRGRVWTYYALVSRLGTSRRRDYKLMLSAQAAQSPPMSAANNTGL